ncbi:hypothetical protein PENSPDRAFT_646964 [Peniophora sp. CONT]|nr:hypothetical protein PENSPDRAFT_646964 [Peniophora sp. CONT]
MSVVTSRMRVDEMGPAPPYGQHRQHARCKPSDLLASPDETALLKVEGRLFSLNARWLRSNSHRFRRLRRSSTSPSDLSITLPDVTIPEIEALEEFIENSAKSSFWMPTKKWIHLLAVAYKLEATTLRSLAASELFHEHAALSPVAQLALYEAYDAPRTPLCRAVRAIITRPEPLDEKEVSGLSDGMLSRLIAMRETYIRAQAGPMGYLKASSTADAIVAYWVRTG